MNFIKKSENYGLVSKNLWHFVWQGKFCSVLLAKIADKTEWFHAWYKLKHWWDFKIRRVWSANWCYQVTTNIRYVGTIWEFKHQDKWYLTACLLVPHVPKLVTLIDCDIQLYQTSYSLQRFIHQICDRN